MLFSAIAKTMLNGIIDKTTMVNAIVIHVANTNAEIETPRSVFLIWNICSIKLSIRLSILYLEEEEEEDDTVLNCSFLFYSLLLAFNICLDMLLYLFYFVLYRQ